MLAPIQMINHRFVEFTLKPAMNLTDEDRKRRSLTCRHQFGWHHDKQSNIWLCRLRVELIDPENSPETHSLYTGGFEAIGEFKLHASVPEKDQLKLFSMNAGGMLYASIREWVATLSSRSIHGLVEMPTIDARNFYTEVEAALKEQPVA